MSAASQADLLIRNIDWLITVDAGRRIIRDIQRHRKHGEARFRGGRPGVRDGRFVRTDQDEVMREVVTPASELPDV